MPARSKWVVHCPSSAVIVAFSENDVNKANRRTRPHERLADEVHELAELDTMLPSNDRQTVGLAVGIRPWTVSMLSGLPLRKA